jgi:hypothetical protein
MSYKIKFTEHMRKHILETHDFCSFFSMVEEQMRHVNSPSDESKELNERLLAMRIEFFPLLQIFFSPLLQPLLNTRLFPLVTWFVVATPFQPLR